MIASLGQSQTIDCFFLLLLLEKTFPCPFIDWFIQQTDLNIGSLSACLDQQPASQHHLGPC